MRSRHAPKLQSSLAVPLLCVPPPSVGSRRASKNRIASSRRRGGASISERGCTARGSLRIDREGCRQDANREWDDDSIGCGTWAEGGSQPGDGEFEAPVKEDCSQE